MQSEKKKINYTVLDLFGKRYVWLPCSLFFFEADDLLEKALAVYNTAENERIAFMYSFNPDQREAAAGLWKELQQLEAEDSGYRKEIQSMLEDESIVINSIELNPVFGCNLRCRYCFAGDGGHYKKGRMPAELAKRMVDFLIKQSGDQQKIFIGFIGGEPLLNLQLIREVLEYSSRKAEEAGKEVLYTTTVNGTLLDREARELLDHYRVRIMLSLDSPLPETQNYLRPQANNTGSYDLIMANGWKNILESRSRAVRATITPHNLDVYEIARTYYDAGFQHVHLEEVTTEKEEFQFSEKDIKTLKAGYEKLALFLVKRISQGADINCKPLLSRMYEIHNRRPRIVHCGAFSNSIGISPLGDAYPCDWMMQDKFKLGNVLNGFNLDNYFLLKKQYPVLPVCDECWARYLCGGGCRIKHIAARENGRGLDCDLDLHKFKLQLYVYSEIARQQPDFLKRYNKSSYFGAVHA